MRHLEWKNVLLNKNEKKNRQERYHGRFLNVKFREFNLLIPFAENGDLLYQHKISVIL